MKILDKFGYKYFDKKLKKYQMLILIMNTFKIVIIIFIARFWVFSKNHAYPDLKITKFFEVH